ncbi:di-heme oxidoredictase family protein [Singulisphaera rosea]
MGLVTIIVPVGYRTTGWLLRYDGRPKADARDSQAGRDLFLHEWTAGDKLAASGDGLGPVFNANSCVACHRQGGVGGSGPQEHNVTVFTRAAKPGASAGSGVIHQFGIDAASQETLANISPSFPKKSRPSLADLQEVLAKPGQTAAVVQTNQVGVVREIDIGQRNTPALFGAHVIDAIPDSAILANERDQHFKIGLMVFNGEATPAGRAAKLPRRRVGKFGWKANVGNLSEFVRVACANELGLGNPLQAQPASLSQPWYQPRGLDLTDKQCDQMTAYIASLPMPQEVIPSSADEAARAVAGKKHFKQIGCTNCHTPDVAEARGLYSDLLLHEMGEGLGGGGFYGEESPDTEDFDTSTRSPSEWRTPPLWGVADSAPYLHDGRATTLTEAIKLHSGQALPSANRFAGLSFAQQDELITFLNTLRAPGVGLEGRDMTKSPMPKQPVARMVFGSSPKLNVLGILAGTPPAASLLSIVDR